MLTKKYFVFFTISIATFSAINFSQWAGIENYPHRYYVLSYFFFIMGVLFSLDELIKVNLTRFILLVTLTTSTVGALSYVKLNKEQTRFKIDEKAYKTLNSFNQSTFIGDYWYTYVMGSYNAKKITSIASEQSHLRNPNQLDKAFRNSTVYLIKNNWLKGFPDTVLQYGKKLIKDKNKNDIIIGNAIIHQYLNEDLIIEKNILNKLKNTILKNKHQIDIIYKKVKHNRNYFYNALIKEWATLLEKEKKIRIVEQNIKSDSIWIKSVEEKAKLNNIPLSEMIRIDAEYILNQESK